MYQEELIPGLPEDIARECLIRIPFTYFSLARLVCKLWKQEIESEHFHHVRKLCKITRPVMAFAQAEPAFASTGPAHKYHSATSALMSYKLTAFDPLSEMWHSLPPIPDMPHGLPLFCQLAAVGLEVVVIGGWDPETWAPLDTVFIYDFVTDTWRNGACMPGPKRAFFACASSGDSGTAVFVAGGHDEEKNALRSAMEYDVARDMWVPMPDMAMERDECKGVFLTGRFHVIGGYPTEQQGRFCKSAESFDVDMWQWGPAEDDRLDAAMCPRTCVVGGDGRMYMCRGGHVAVLDGDTWRSVSEVPVDASVAPTLATCQGKMMLIGSGGYGGAQVGYVMELGNKQMTWQKVEVPFEFSGHVQAACCLEI